MTLPLSIESFPVLSQILMLALIIVILVLVYYLMRPWWRQRRQSRLDLRIAIPEFLSVSPIRWPPPAMRNGRLAGKFM
mgnify:CR=1 FL=1